MASFVAALGVAWFLTLLVLRVSKRFAHLTNDHDLDGPQKIHASPVPRVGGVGIFLGCLVAIGLAGERSGGWLMACAIPAFGTGLWEDLTKRISPRMRLTATAISALAAGYLLGALLKRADLWGLDWLLTFTPVAVLFTVLAVAGIANAINIIDGFNGLASMCVVIMLAGIAYVAQAAGDPLVFRLALVGAGAVLGFFLWNYPAGYIFLGDGGAYFLGFYVAELGILLITRNPTVSPLFPLLVCIYPVFETLFSIYRRIVVRGRSPSMPDGIHLHSLVFKRLVRWAVGSSDARLRTRRNSMTSPYLWVLCMLSVFPATLCWDSTEWLLAFLLLFSAGYVLLYSRIVRFKTPRWMILRR